MPKVSAIINTKSRPVEVVDAIRSVLAQTYRDIEILVVVDGTEPATERALADFAATLPAPGFRVIVNPVNVGVAEARNIGVRASLGQHVAFLDDDDTWMPTKIEEQMHLATCMTGDHHFIACRFIERTGKLEKIWPETLLNPKTPFSEYLFVHRSMLLPSVLMASRQLMLDVPFDRTAFQYTEDLDWMLRAAADPRTQIAIAPSQLAIYNNQVSPTGARRGTHWLNLYIWALRRRDLFTPLAFSCFLTRGVVPRARAAGASARELLHLLSASLLLGSFNLAAIFSFLLSISFTIETKAWGRRLLSHKARLSTREDPK